MGAFEDAVAGWRADEETGKRSLLLAATREQVSALADRARELRVGPARWTMPGPSTSPPVAAPAGVI